MKVPKILLAPALTAPFLVAFGAFAEAPKFAPADGLSLSKRVTTKTELSLDEMSMVMNGEEMPFEMNIDSTVTVVTAVTDEYAGVADGRPVKLKRTFDELNSSTEASMSNPMSGDSDTTSSGSSDLEGTTVVFSWDADLEDFAVAFDEDSDADDELLEGLTEDLDFRMLLPPGDVSEGDTWSIEPNAIRSILAPCGNVKIVPDDAAGGGMDMGGGGPMSMGQFLDNLEGNVTATFAGLEDADGASIAVIELEIDVNSAMDLTEWFTEMMENQEMPEGMEFEIEVDSFDTEFLFEGSGALRWNMSTGVVHSLEVTGDVKQSNDTSMNIAVGGMEQNMEQSMEFAGTQTITLTTEG